MVLGKWLGLAVLVVIYAIAALERRYEAAIVAALLAFAGIAMTLAAEHTSIPKIGPMVTVPRTRHPSVSACAIGSSAPTLGPATSLYSGTIG